MDNKLLIIGAGIYAQVAYEIACDMNCFERIDFVDDQKTQTITGRPVIGDTDDLPCLSKDYTHGVVAIGDPCVRLQLLTNLKEQTDLHIATLISPKAYVAPSATVEEGTIVEPMAVINSLCRIERGCLISAGAVVNHAAVCGKGVHLDCNVTVEGYSHVPLQTKVPCGTVFGNTPCVATK